jgi:hypothetical protein
MQQAFHHGGWGMYPTTIVGLVLLFTALMYARDPDARRMRSVRYLSVLTLLVSVLGFTTGVIRSFMAAGDIPGSELGNVVVAGVGESLNNIGLGLVILVMTWILASIGAARMAPGRASLSDAHAP